jgi:hypothetical protein
MSYRGTVDFQGKLDAMVDADPLHDAWLVGKLVSAALWLPRKFFEYHLTGTLTDPKEEPRYFLPSLLSLPFLPFKAVKEMMPGDTKPADTKAPDTKPADTPPKPPPAPSPDDGKTPPPPTVPPK